MALHCRFLLQLDLGALRAGHIQVVSEQHLQKHGGPIRINLSECYPPQIVHAVQSLRNRVCVRI